MSLPSWTENTRWERMAEVMFETFNVPAMYVNAPAVFSLYASNRITGCVFECVEEATYATAIYEGCALSGKNDRCMYFGGGLLMHHISKSLRNHDYSSFSASVEGDVAHDIKEKLCYVALGG